MGDFLYVRDLYDVVMRDLKNLPLMMHIHKTDLSRYRSIPSAFHEAVGVSYSGTRCILEETDFEHINSVFLTGLSSVNIRLGDNGIRVYASLEERGRNLGPYFLSNDALERKALKEAMKLPISKPKGIEHDLREPIKLGPKAYREKENEIVENVYLIEDFWKPVQRSK